MTVVRVRGLVIVAIAAAQLLSCGGSGPARAQDPSYTAMVEPGTSEPADDLERTILAKLGDLEDGVESSIDGYVVVAAAPYSAASGRTCRSVAFRPGDGAGAARSRLACLIEDRWAFVPEVFRPLGTAR